MNPQFSSRLRRIQPRVTNEIRRYRLQAGLTQRQLARQLGVRLSTYTGWERGNTCPSLPNIFKLAKMLNTLAEGLYPEFYAARKETPVAAEAA
jgi:transcriptional regulator with XRE-family HTH domain